MSLTRHELSPLPTPIFGPDRTPEAPTQIVIGWDALFGSYYLHVWTHEHLTPYGLPSIIYTDVTRFPPDPATIIEYARAYASIPDQLPAILTRDAATEGFYTGPTHTSPDGNTLTEGCTRVREHFGLTDCPF